LLHRRRGDAHPPCRRALGDCAATAAQQIKALEAELGLKLFACAGRGVALTEAGRLFHAEAKSILEHVERATILARQVANGHVGRLRVGFTESASFSPVFTRTFAAFRAKWPGVELELDEAHTETQVERLRQGRLDAGFVRPPIPAGSPMGHRAKLSISKEMTGPLRATSPSRTNLTGRLSCQLQAKLPDGIERRWADEPGAALETRIPNILASFSVWAELGKR
jgi:DNA-binding transcriptional LysR family regulator